MNIIGAVIAAVLYIFGCVLVADAFAPFNESRLARVVGILGWPLAVLWGLVEVLWDNRPGSRA